MKQTSINILELDKSSARDYFLATTSFCTIDLPNYITFDRVLSFFDKKLKSRKGIPCHDISKICNQIKKNGKDKNVRPIDYTDINHTIFFSKTNKYDWRRLQIIHPALYVSFVNLITQHENWDLLVNRFKYFIKHSKNIICESYPRKSLSKQSDTAEQITNWLSNIENKSIEYALEFEYLFEVDIEDCYSSIYTHTIAWALHGKSKAKQNREPNKLLGNKIDKLLMSFSNGQTNGIPQGSVISDFIAEIILGYADTRLSEKITNKSIAEYKILRYRDDYRIFVNNPQQGELILKLLTEVLSELNFKLNTSKCRESSNIISNSIKEEKLFWLTNKTITKNIQNQLLIIYDFSVKYPKPNILKKILFSEVYEKIVAKNNIIKNEQIIAIISITTEIAIRNPLTWTIVSAILSLCLKKISDKKTKIEIIRKIYEKTRKVCNLGWIDSAWTEMHKSLLNKG